MTTGDRSAPTHTHSTTHGQMPGSHNCSWRPIETITIPARNLTLGVQRGEGPAETRSRGTNSRMRLRRKEHGFDAAVLGLVSSSLWPDAAELPAAPSSANQSRPALRAGVRRAGCEADLDAAVLNALFDSTPPPARRQTRYESAASSEAEDTRGAYGTSIRSVSNARRYSPASCF